MNEDQLTFEGPRGVLLRYKADRRPVAIAVLLFAVHLALYFYATPWVALLALPLIMVPSAMVAAYNHHHQHLNVFRSPTLNRLYDLILGLQTGIGPYGWVLHHNLGHHPNYLNQPPHEDYDESHWARRDGSKMGRIEYTLHTFLFNQVEIHKVGQRHPKVYRHYLLMKLPYYALVALGIWYSPINYLLVFLIPGALTLGHTCWATYEHHSGQETSNHFVASTNRIHPLFNFLSCNLGLHTAHHLKPGLHWSLLPQLHAQIEPRIPARLQWNRFW